MHFWICLRGGNTSLKDRLRAQAEPAQGRITKARVSPFIFRFLAVDVLWWLSLFLLQSPRLPHKDGQCTLWQPEQTLPFLQLFLLDILSHHWDESLIHEWVHQTMIHQGKKKRWGQWVLNVLLLRYRGMWSVLWLINFRQQIIVFIAQQH